ncbi:MAG: hypothetical protein PHY54_03930 [Methylococcales bacterium]|nr:hypothetical protein [Methylococcales bacterium]
MTHFLWVEDFNASEDKRPDNIISSTVKSVFGSVLDEKELREQLKKEDEYDAQDFLARKGIFLKLNLLEALQFIRNPDELVKIDFVVLDVDMPLCRDGQKDGKNYLPSLIEQYGSADDLRKIAGYQIYTELVIELGFPKSHILFCSNHATYFDELKKKFTDAKLKPPLSSNPDKPFLKKEDADDINQWLHRAICDYFVLRRGIIEGCRYAKSLSKESFYFDNFMPKKNGMQYEEIISYFEILENFLPLRQPENKLAIYKLFVRTLSHEWEAAKNIKPDKEKSDAVLAWIMRNTRHWITHNSSLFSDADEQLIAFLFMVNLRVMFSYADYSIQNYESILLKLFDNESLSKEELEEKCIPVSEAYLALRNIIRDENQNQQCKNLNIEEAFYFNEMANNVQLSSSALRNDKNLFTKLLYQMFWLTTCNPFVDRKNNNSLEIKFWNFNYSAKPYMLEIARSIYHRSFPKA